MASNKGETIPNGAVMAAMSFIDDNPIFLSEKPYLLLLPGDTDFPPTNCTFSRHQTVIRDRRSDVGSLSLKEDGFFILHHRFLYPNLRSVVGQESAPEDLLAYLSEVTALVKDYLGADKAICIDWRVSISKGIEPRPDTLVLR